MTGLLAARRALGSGILGLACVGWAVVMPPASGQEGRSPRPTPADQKLLDELEGDLLGDLPASKQPPRSGAATPGADAVDPQLKELLRDGEDLGSAPEHPLARIGQQMRTLAERIALKDTSAATQQTQGQVVEELDKLIEQAKKQAASGNKSGSGRGTGRAGVGDGQAQPGAPQESTDRVGPADSQAAEKTDVQDLLRRIWGHLPEKQRDAMQNAFSDQFLPKYEKLIEEYFQRLAEERATP